MDKSKSETKYKVGIISFNTHTINSNFGAALHSFAFQKYLNGIGISSVIIRYRRFYFKFDSRLFFRHFPLCFFMLFFRFIKQLKFDKFFKKHCVVSENIYNRDTISDMEDMAELYCCETDITWCRLVGGGKYYDRAFMCDYPHMKGKDNIAFSVDFGSGLIEMENQKQLFEYAKNFKYISPERKDCF